MNSSVSGVIDVAIGVVFVYLLMSLMCSALTEALETWCLRFRGKKLYQGLYELFGGGQSGKTAQFLASFYQHPLIFGLYSDSLTPLNNSGGQSAQKPEWRKLPKNLPSYLAPKTFALALVGQLLDDQPMSATSLIDSLNKSQALPEPAKKSLSLLITAAGNDMDKVLANIEDWYSAMGERISGWYKKHAQKIAFMVAVVLTAVGNVDTLAITKALMVNDKIRGEIAEVAEQYVKTYPVDGCKGTLSEQCQYQQQMAQLAELNQLGLPIGWQNCHDLRIYPHSTMGWAEKILGLLMTALATSVGAPFWFDILNKFMNFRASIKPQAKETGVISVVNNNKPTANGVG